MKLLAKFVICLVFSTISFGDDSGLTFFGWSDQHIKTDGDANHLHPAMDAMNALEGTPYPESIGGKVGKPSFVMGAGDITEWPTNAALKAYDGLIRERLKIPAYDILGNHDDGGLAPSDTMKRWLKERHGSLTYTFDRGRIHFICLFSEYNHKADNPAQPVSKEALDFIRKGLAKLPGDMPVVIVLHLCFEAITNRDALVDSFGKANVILVLGGHYHKATVNRYRGFHFVQLPSPAEKEKHFTVIRITADRLVAIPYDYKRKEWIGVEQKHMILDVPIKGPTEQKRRRRL